MLNRLKRPEFLIVAVYLLFCFWYTNTKGPLTTAEINGHLDYMTSRGTPTRQLTVLKHFMQNDTGNHFVMINLLDLNPSPPNLPATGPDAAPMALIDHYMAHMYPTMLQRASHPIYLAPVQAGAMDLLNAPYASDWTQTALMRYRSRRDIMEIITDPRFAERHEYKGGGLLKTIAVPTEPTLNPGDPRLLLGLVGVILMLLFRRR
jgi:hypothetical protein